MSYAAEYQDEPGKIASGALAGVRRSRTNASTVVFTCTCTATITSAITNT